MKSLHRVCLSVLVCAVPAYHHGLARAQQPTAVEAQTTPATPDPKGSNKEVNDQYVRRLMERIAGREKDPAEKVFKNIQIPWLKSVPADRFLAIMNFGYSRALGVACTHCHATHDFSSDDKRPKRAAREMAVMHHMINDQLRNMRNLELPPDKRSINCFSCHRGGIDPTKTE